MKVEYVLQGDNLCRREHGADQPIWIDLLDPTMEEEAEVVQAQQPLSMKDVEIGAREDGNGGGGNNGNGDGLPFSKARCIALVVTVTGAAFLNVRFSIFLISEGTETAMFTPTRLITMYM